MKNTDLELLKSKFENSGVNAPEQLNADFVKNKISGIEPVAEVKSSYKKKAFGISFAAAAALFTVGAFVFTLIIGDDARLLKRSPLSRKITQTASLTSFSSHEEVKAALKQVMDLQSTVNSYYSYNSNVCEEYGAAEDSVSGSSGSSSSFLKSSDLTHNATYVQEVGVDEADTVKTDGNYIYYLANDNLISVFSANGSNSEQAAQITAGENSYFSDFYIYGAKLITLSNSYLENGEYEYRDITKVNIYDISSVNDIKLTDSFSQSGRYCSSRMIDSMLYVVSTQYSYGESDLPFCYDNDSRATKDQASVNEIPADCIYSVENPTESSFLVVSSIDTGISTKATKTKAILGSADEIYCNQEFLYITAREYEPVLYDDLVNNNFSGSYAYDYTINTDYTQIVKVSLDKDIEFVASANVNGAIDNQYSMDEYNGFLRVATTSSNDKGNDVNNLYVLDKDLKQVGEVTGFAENESIKAVRYIDDTAYVITYEQTDPLFVIDVSEPSNPKITGEVKISGFSTLLVPVDENTLLGIGYHTQDEDDGIDMEIQEGLKIVTFDISDKSNPQVLDSKVFTDYYSQVQYNPKALLVNFERGDYTIPVNYSHYEDDYEYYNYKAHSGVLNFKVENGRIEIVDEYISDKFGKNNQNVDIDRCVYVGDYVYMLGVNYNYNYYDSEDYYDYDYDAEPETIIDCVKYK